MMNEEVRRIMTKNPATVNPQQTVAEVSNILKNNRTHHVPVVDQGKLVGMVTTYDLWNKMEGQDVSPQTEVGQIMNPNFIHIIPKDKVGTAAELFLDNRFHALPVINLNGELKGVVTSYDVLKYTYKKEYSDSVVKPEIFQESP